jgi:hypothetical protein
MGIVLVVAFAVAGVVHVATWILTGNPGLAVVAATTVSVAIVAVGDTRW